MRSERLMKECWLVDEVYEIRTNYWITFLKVLVTWYNLSRKKKQKHEKQRRKKLLHWSLINGKEHFLLMLKERPKMKCKMEAKDCSLILWSTSR